ncbi:Intraflagellar transport protein 74 [Chytridiales sp. JEL 0842]|nr:Intraflagellar transport protein 74 [Chytridiales sp. JEL 0842]
MSDAQGPYGRPPTGSLANRPGSRLGAPPQEWNRGGPGGMPGTGMPPRTGMPPGTARMGPPGTGARPITGARGFGFNVVDRPMTQQGLGGMRGNVQGIGRMVQDKTYFQTELRQKINILTAELNKMNQEAEATNKENSNYTIFEKRADGLAQELRDLQGQLGDLNTLVDKLHTDSDLADIERQQEQLKLKNHRESQILDEIFAQRQQKENLVRDVEKAIELERKKAEAQINDLDPERRAAYFEIKEENNKYLVDIQNRQVELDELQAKIATLQQSLRFDKAKQTSLTIHQKLSELRSKKTELEDSLRALENENGPNEKNRLLEQVKEDNQETSAMERKILELEEQVQRQKEQLSNIEMDLDTNQGERNSKYEELVKRDKEMQNFLETFEDRKRDSLERNIETEKQIVALLDQIKNLAKHEAMPSQNEHRELQGDLRFKEREMKNSENTMEAVLIERDRRLQDLEKVNQLETKLNAELKHLRQKISQQEEDLQRVSNVEAVKREAEDMKRRNLADRETLRIQRDTLKQNVQLLAAKNDARSAQLHENETYTQLGALEQRLRHHESNNFHLKDYIQAKNSESDYKPLAQDTSKLVDEINQQIGKILSLPPAR